MRQEDMVEVSPQDYRELKGLYQQAVENNVEVFWWKDKEILTNYAKYVLQYLEMQGFK